MSMALSTNAAKLLGRLKQSDCGLTDEQLDSWAQAGGIGFPRGVFRTLEDAGVARIQLPDPGSGRPKRYKATKQAWEIQ